MGRSVRVLPQLVKHPLHCYFLSLTYVCSHTCSKPPLHIQVRLRILNTMYNLAKYNLKSQLVKCKKFFGEQNKHE